MAQVLPSCDDFATAAVPMLPPPPARFSTMSVVPSRCCMCGWTKRAGMSGKRLELINELAPRVTRAAVLRDPAGASGIGQFGAVQAVAPALGVELNPIDVRDAGKIERAVSAFARSPNGGLIVTGSPLAAVHRELIIMLAARHKLPAVYFRRLFVNDGGLTSYGPDFLEQHRQAAGYVDRILGARSLPICRCKRRRSMSCSSI